MKGKTKKNGSGSVIVTASTDFIALVSYAIVVCDNAGNILECNPAAEKLIGWKKKEIEGLSITDSIIAFALQKQFIKQLKSHKTQKKKNIKASFETVVVTKKRKEFFAQVSPTYIKKSKGSLIFFCFRDITRSKKAEADLKQSEINLKRAQSIASFGSWEMTDDMVETYWSDEFYRIHGLRPKSVKPSSKLRLSMVHPEDRIMFQKATELAIRENKAYSIEKRIILRNGKTRWLLARGEAFSDHDTGKLRLLGTVIDITDRKLQDEEIVQLNNSLKDFQNAITGSSIVSRADRRGIITFVNENFVKISGYSSEELIGQNHRIVNSAHHPKSFWIEMWKTIANGKIWRAEVKNKAKDGSFYWVDTFVMPFLDEKGTVREFLSIRNDITKRKAQEENIVTLNQSLADFQNAIQSSSIVSRADKAGIITYVNGNFEKISGYKSHELIGMNHRIINSGHHPKSFWVEMWKTIANGKIWRAEVKNKAKNGTFYWVDTFVMPFIDEQGRVKEFLSIRNDITSRKQSEEALRDSRQKAEIASQAKSEFLANMSHEIRTPLNGVIGFSDLLMKTNLDAIQKQYMGTISQSANSLLDIINNILDFSKIEAGKMELSPEPTDLFTLCDQVTEIVSHQATQKNIKLFYTYSKELPRLILVDPIRLKQVLVNLLGNAIKFTEVGEIELKVEPSEMSVPATQRQTNIYPFRFSVHDTGVGIQKQNQQKIFEAFSQEDSSVTKKYGGTGLGLSISNKLLNLMTSRLNLISQPGKGSIFYFDVAFDLPTTKLQTPKKELNKNGSSAENEVVFKRDGNLNILIAEDNLVNMALARAIIGNVVPNARIIEASNGKLAVEAFKRERPDIIFMDVQMPVMNGYEAASQIRETEKDDVSKQKVPIIALTAGALQGEREKCLEAGMDDFIIKPIVNNAIEQVLIAWLAKSPLKINS